MRASKLDQATTPRTAVVIPCYRVIRHVGDVIDGIGPEVERIYCVDDACPEGSGDWIEHNVKDQRVIVLRNDLNEGVGGAVVHGYRRAITEGFDIVVKVDGDGQMDPSLIPLFIAPIVRGEADYTKGNRFWDLAELKQMPLMRRIGNLGLSFMAKASSGYWDIFDPTNGYTAIHCAVADRLSLGSLSKRYFFETDLLYRLNTIRAVVRDVPMDAKYGDEISNLKITKVLFEFLIKHVRNTCARTGYNYFLRDFTAASLQLLFGMALLVFGLAFGALNWWQYANANLATPLGTVMIATISIVSGLQFFLAFASYDIANVPRVPLHSVLQSMREFRGRGER